MSETENKSENESENESKSENKNESENKSENEWKWVKMSENENERTVQVKNHFWDRSQNRTTFGTGGFGVTESDVAGHFESYKARILPLYVRRASMCGINLD